MPKPRRINLETSTARLKLAIQKKPYRSRLGPGLSLGYRRNEGPGTWSVIAADGRGQEWLKKIGVADDRDPANGKEILNYTQAVDIARVLTQGGGEVENASQPATLKLALAAYEADLTARGANTYNARWPLKYLPSLLLAKPIPLIEANELRRWRDSLLKDHAPATVNRLAGATVAALNLAAAHDPRIKSRQPWHVGLQGLPDATRARNIVLSDDEVRALISAAYARNQPIGLFVETLGVTGARPSQVARLEVGDLRAADLAEAKLMMPRSGKGGGRLRVRKKVERISVPITAALAVRLKTAAAGRPSNAPLLLWRGERGWGVEPSANYRADFRAIVAAAGLDPAEVTAYALRHCSIVRMLLAGIPVRLVASLHDTSVTEIERHYSKYISEGAHSDALSRRALLADEPPVADNVVALAR
jgi:integrase